MIVNCSCVKPRSFSFRDQLNILRKSSPFSRLVIPTTSTATTSASTSFFCWRPRLSLSPGYRSSFTASNELCSIKLKESRKKKKKQWYKQNETKKKQTKRGYEILLCAIFTGHSILESFDNQLRIFTFCQNEWKLSTALKRRSSVVFLWQGNLFFNWTLHSCKVSSVYTENF